MATTVENSQLFDLWQDAATQTLPDYSRLVSSGFAQDGDPVSGQMATRPSSAWFNLIAAMRVSVIRAAGLVPSTPPDPQQFLTALQSLAWMQDQKITTTMLANGLITAVKLANNAVQTAKIQDAAVTAAKIAASAIQTAKIQDAAVTNAKIAAATIAFDRLASAAIATQNQATAGTANNVLMTPLRAKQLMDSQMPPACPTGMVAYFALTAVPDGWLMCNGSKVSRTTYAALFAAIGTRFGSGDGSTTFTLPNLNARFIEGTTTTSSVGQYVEAGLPNITGKFGTMRNDGDTYKYASDAFGTESYGYGYTGEYNVAGFRWTFSASKYSSVYGQSSGVQPLSILLLPCIKS